VGGGAPPPLAWTPHAAAGATDWSFDDAGYDVVDAVPGAGAAAEDDEEEGTAGGEEGVAAPRAAAPPKAAAPAAAAAAPPSRSSSMASEDAAPVAEGGEGEAAPAGWASF
jgi:hypothetical protein